MDIMCKAIHSTFESQSMEEGDEHEKLGEKSNKPNDLSERVQTLGNGQVYTHSVYQEPSH